jgi:hypothetical protein
MWAVDRNHATTAMALIAAKADVNGLSKVSQSTLKAFTVLCQTSRLYTERQHYTDDGSQIGMQ